MDQDLYYFILCGLIKWYSRCLQRQDSAPHMCACSSIVC